MSGTIKGGYKTSATNKEKYGKDYYANIGRKGGKKSRTGGFASHKVGRDGLTGVQRAKIAGAKGGHISKRKPATHEDNAKRTQAINKLAQVLADYIPTEVN